MRQAQKSTVDTVFVALVLGAGVREASWSGEWFLSERSRPATTLRACDFKVISGESPVSKMLQQKERSLHDGRVV